MFILHFKDFIHCLPTMEHFHFHPFAHALKQTTTKVLILIYIFENVHVLYVYNHGGSIHQVLYVKLAMQCVSIVYTAWLHHLDMRSPSYKDGLDKMLLYFTSICSTICTGSNLKPSTLTLLYCTQVLHIHAQCICCNLY